MNMSTHHFIATEFSEDAPDQVRVDATGKPVALILNRTYHIRVSGRHFTRILASLRELGRGHQIYHHAIKDDQFVRVLCARRADVPGILWTPDHATPR